MKYAEKCPKCGGFVQTKSVRKSIGLGFVEIPIAQFCLNPVCDWYQDFAEIRKPEEIKEGYHLKKPSIKGNLPRINMPALSRNNMIMLGSIFAIIIIYFLITTLAPLSNPVSEKNQQVPPAGISNNTTPNNTFKNTTNSATNTASESGLKETPKVTTAVPTPDTIELNIEPRSISVKIDAGHGFFPDPVTINISDTIVWNNEGNLRPRVVLVSRDGLFENQLIQNLGRYQYQFNKSGKYTFTLAEYDTNKEYPVTGSVIVK